MKYTKEKMLYQLIKGEAERLYKNNQYKFKDGEELVIYDNELLGDDEVEMNFKYANGIAVNEDCTYALVYPRRETLNNAMRIYIAEYDGIPAPRDYTNRDIALTYGRLIKL